MKCYNCGSDDLECRDTIERRGPDVIFWCRECGTLWWGDDDEPDVPRRSQPAEVRELPDEGGPWWHWLAGKWKIVDIGFHPDCDGAKKPFFSGYEFGNVIRWCQPGRYVRAQPPIVAPPEPEPTAKDDAAWLRSLEGNLYIDIKDLERLRGIAARLERLAAGEE